MNEKTMHQYKQVSLDLMNMIYTAISYFALAGAAWLFLRLLQACFWLPSRMKKQNDIQSMLQSKIDSYEAYVKQCDKNESEGNVVDYQDGLTPEERQKERKECLDMLKKELKRIQDGGDPYDCDYLLEDDDKKAIEADDDGQAVVEEVEEEVKKTK